METQRQAVSQRHRLHPWQVAELAQKASLSRAAFALSKAFKRIAGVSPQHLSVAGDGVMQRHSLAWRSDVIAVLRR